MLLPPGQGRNILLNVIGHQLHGVRRWVMDLGGANDEFGHGITELTFDNEVVIFRPGPNEDFIVVENGPVQAVTFDERYFTRVDLECSRSWTTPSGVVKSIDILSDGLEDVGVVFRFETGDTLLIALTDTDLVIARDETVFERDPEVDPVLRETLT